jgi:hypothetical protein
MKRVRISTDDPRPVSTGPTRVAPGGVSFRAGANETGGLRATEITGPTNPSLSEAERDSQLRSFVVPLQETMEQPLIFDYDTPSQHAQSNHSRPSRGGGTSVFPDVGYSPQDLGHGTLVMSRSGAASKYLGHTAASEWLKDVSGEVVLR